MQVASVLLNHESFHSSHHFHNFFPRGFVQYQRKLRKNDGDEMKNASEITESNHGEINQMEIIADPIDPRGEAPDPISDPSANLVDS